MAVSGHDEVLHIAVALLEGVFPVTKGVRLLGVTLSALGEEADDDRRQPSLLL